MKIAILANQFPAISETFILQQVIEALERGHDVHVYAGRPPTGQPRHPSVTEYDISRRTRYWPSLSDSAARRLISLAKGAGPLLLKNPQTLVEALRPHANGPQWKSGRFLVAGAGLRGIRERYDVIHCHFGTLGLVGLFLRRCGIVTGPVLTSFHGADVSVSPRKWGPDVYRSLFRSDSWFTANSEHTRRQLCALGCPRDRIRLLRMGIRMSDFNFMERRLQTNETATVVSIARLVEKKGLEYGIRGIHGLLTRGFAVRHLIIGDGPLRTSLEALIAELGVSEHVHLLGWKTTAEVRAILDGTHLVLQPSVTDSSGDEEGQGLALQEAQASGIPVVATRHNGFPEGVLDGISGVLVPERDAEAIVRAVADLLEQSQRWPEMGRKGRAFVAGRFDAGKLAGVRFSMYEALAAGRALPGDETEPELLP